MQPEKKSEATNLANALQQKLPEANELSEELQAACRDTAMGEQARLIATDIYRLREQVDRLHRDVAKRVASIYSGAGAPLGALAWYR